MKILFLDIDGVLNTHEPLDPEVMCGRFHPDKVARLNHVLRMTGAKIVLSSAWRYFVHRGEMTIAGVEWLLRSHGVMQQRLIGITRPDTMQERCPTWNGNTPWPVCDERGHQIASWIAFNRTRLGLDSYAVVDDGGFHQDGSWTDLGITASGHPFVRVEGLVGLTWADANRLIQLLGRVPTEVPA